MHIDESRTGIPALAILLLFLGVTASAPSQTILLQVTDTVPGFGAPVAGVGDIDGDGVPDILGSAPGFTAPPFVPYAGRARVYSGATGGVLLEWVGTQANAFLGFHSARRGDANGDGVPDVMFSTSD
ncbi:MAG: FG-GAP repeat domain-containing protein, partial [Planctomycetota bacterium]